jgi:hypothetical protein
MNADLPKSIRGKLAYYIDEIEKLKHEGFTYNEILERIRDELGLPATMRTQSFIMGVRKATENIKSGAYVVEQRSLSTSAVQLPAHKPEKRTVAEMVQSAKEGMLTKERVRPVFPERSRLPIDEIAQLVEDAKQANRKSASDRKQYKEVDLT